ncbi:MAG: DUF3344 domain-containing protein [Methanobrevibacter sp.]|nr:DUF3344 domain-containing protein [Methanobrevibacter sp.]
MKFKNGLLICSIFLFFVIISSGIVFAEDSALPLVDSGEVSGGVDISSVNPFNSTSSELIYEIPEDATEIRSANVVVSTYSGSGAPTYGLTTNISLNTNDKSEILEYANLTYLDSTASDPVIYPITNFTSKQYSDYQSLFDITEKVKGLSSGDTITVSVNNTALEGYKFDGRIKLIALIFAYDDGDNDKITYWLNVGQAWTKETLTTVFNTKEFDDEYSDVVLESIALSSADATYMLNGKLLLEPQQEQGDYYIYDVWNIGDKFELGNNTILTYTSSKASTYSSYKASIQLLKINTPEKLIPTGVNKLVTEYTSVSTVQAGVENTLTLTVENDGTANATNVTVKVLLGNETLFEDVVANYDVGSSYKFSVIDPTIRDIDASTEFGANNTFADYTVVIEENGVEINSTDYSFPLRYNGNLGKDYEYPVVNSTEIVRFYDITGDVIYVNSDDSAYMGTGATSRNETLTANFDGDVVDSLLYVSYNWDGVDSGDFNTWNVTFNNVAVTPIANYRDQGNLGNYGNKGYGLVVYNVSSLVKSGDNLVTISKNSGKSAVYPSSLLILTNNNESETTKNVYIAENADLLAKTYSKNLTVGANTQFNDLSLNRIINATLYVFAASAQNGEGNIIFNDVTSENVWNGTSNSINSYEMDITDIVDESNSLFFESTGSTILALHQIIVVEYESYIVVDAPDVEKYFKGSERFVVNVTDNKGNPISNKSVNITINGRSYIKTTDENGSASIALGLNSGTYNVTTIVDNETFDSVVSILPTVNGTDVVKVYKNGTQYYATFYDSEGNYLKNGTAVKFNINGVIYDRKVSGDKGLAKLNINLPEGEYVITAMNLETGENGVNNITVISKLIENKDITKYYRNATQYTVKVLGDDGNPVGAGENVTFNINGVFYTRTTNESGIAKLNLNLPPGDYVITAEYKGCKVSNNIKVLPVLSAEDITMKYRDGTKFVATLVDGQGKPYAEQTVQFNINGVLYNRVTDSSGQAKLNINLIAGQYIITSSYNGANIANTVTVTQ